MIKIVFFTYFVISFSFRQKYETSCLNVDCPTVGDFKIVHDRKINNK